MALGTKKIRSSFRYIHNCNYITHTTHSHTHTDPPIDINQIVTAVEFLAIVKTRCGF
jgi:hypothetical protein